MPEYGDETMDDVSIIITEKTDKSRKWGIIKCLRRIIMKQMMKP